MIQLLHIDCMEYMATLPDGAFELAIVDPPYGRGEDGGTNRSHDVKQKNGTVLRCVDGGYAKKQWDSAPPPPEYFDELRRVSKHQIIWALITCRSRCVAARLFGTSSTTEPTKAARNWPIAA